MDEPYSKKIFSMVDDVNSDPTMIYFCKSCINAKITRNSSIKFMSEVTTKLGRMHIDLWEPSFDIFLEGNCYM